MRLLGIIAISILATSCYLGDELPPDQDIWEYDHPSNVGLWDGWLLTLDSAIRARQYEQIGGLMIIRDDKIVFENYYDSLTRRHRIISIDKASIAITVAAVGVAIDEGLIELDDPVIQYLPTYESIISSDDRKRDITIGHILTHRSGISWNETISGFTDVNNNLNQMYSSGDWVGFLLNQPLEADPGLRYNFNSGAATIIATVIQNASGQAFDAFVREKLFAPIGVSEVFINQDNNGNYDAGRGFALSFLDWAKFGYLMLNDGLWNGRRVIDPNFVEEATSLQLPVSPWISLGYGWNLLGDDFDNFLPVSKEGIFYISGDIGQHLYIMPEQNMIVSIYAENFFFGFNNPSLNLFIQITGAVSN